MHLVTLDIFHFEWKLCSNSFQVDFGSIDLNLVSLLSTGFEPASFPFRSRNYKVYLLLFTLTF